MMSDNSTHVKDSLATTSEDEEKGLTTAERLRQVYEQRMVAQTKSLVVDILSRMARAVGEGSMCAEISYKKSQEEVMRRVVRVLRDGHDLKVHWLVDYYAIRVTCAKSWDEVSCDACVDASAKEAMRE